LKAPHYITIVAAFVGIAIIYFGGNTQPPAPKTNPNTAAAAGPMQHDEHAVKPASFDSLLLAAKASLPKTSADSILNIERTLGTMSNKLQMVPFYKQMAEIYGRGKCLGIANYYMSTIAKLENSPKKLTFAGQLFLQLMLEEKSPSVQLWEAEEAVGCLELSSKLDDKDEETKLALATAYIEGAGQPMKGVQILKGITNEKPDDIPANMLLGRMSIQSGQFDKAVKRFETILKQEPDNKEANYFMAQTYEGLGDKKKAIEYLERCKKLVNNPEFSKEIDQKINTLK